MCVAESNDDLKRSEESQNAYWLLATRVHNSGKQLCSISRCCFFVKRMNVALLKCLRMLARNSSRGHVYFLEYTLSSLTLAGDHGEQEKSSKPLTGLDPNGAPHKQRP
jgi:hypothetical protein